MKRYRKTATFLIVLSALFPLMGIFSERSNPPVENRVAWDSPQTKETFYEACADCHSHETRYPWYSYLAPASFLTSRNVYEGRLAFNVSFEDMGEAEEAADEVLDGEMPPFDYLLLHPEADLTSEEKERFAEGLARTFGE